ncbi:MAG: helix-turn-helix transcriptional regulator [Spirochaetales bacterium]|nr:helix-turn-helix transcriptional regulator [Spirochaetales bacterium]
MAAAYAIIHIPQFVSYSREILILQRLVSLVAGFPLIQMILSIKQDILKKRAVTIIYTLLSVLFIIGLADLIGHFQWLFYDPPPVIHVTPFFKAVYIPFSFIALGGSYLLVFAASASLSAENKRLIRILFTGLALLLPFQFMDLINLLVKKDPFKEAVFVFNPAILLLFVFVFIFIIEFIRTNTRYAHSSEKKQKKDSVDTQYGDKRKYEHITELITKEKLYANPDLTIDDIAAMCGETRNTVSRLINSYGGKNFKTFINQYRIDCMKKRLEDTSSELSIFEIARQCGFNSKTSLNRIFQQFVHVSPKEYRDQAKQ